MNQDDLATIIDHALLSPALSTNLLEEGIQTALQHRVASVCILPYYLKRCAELLRGSRTNPGTTIGFPHGANNTETKVAEAWRALDDGAMELDMVVNVSEVLSGKWDSVRSDIHSVVEVTHDRGQKIKVIFENCYLNEAQKIRLCEICGELNVDWIKTSTGFGAWGATLTDVQLMRRYAPAHVQIKAAGGIKDLDALLAFHSAGATRIGCSRTAEILGEFRRRNP